MQGVLGDEKLMGSEDEVVVCIGERKVSGAEVRKYNLSERLVAEISNKRV